MKELRRFKALITEMGYDDIGMSGMVFETECFIKDKIYTEEKCRIVYGVRLEPHVIDDTGCVRYIDKLLKEGVLEQLQKTEEVSIPKIERNNEAEKLLDHFYFGNGIANFVFDRDYIQSAQGYTVFLGIMHDYAKLCVEASLTEASKNAMLKTKGGWFDEPKKKIKYSIIEHGSSMDCEATVDEDSITNYKNHKYV